MRCSECGAEIADSARFCPKCGRPCVQPGEPGGGAASFQTSPILRYVVVGAVCAIAAVLACCGFFLYAKSNMAGAFGVTFVNEAAFPDESVRTAVAEQLDADGDGMIGAEETGSVTVIEVDKGILMLRQEVDVAVSETVSGASIDGGSNGGSSEEPVSSIGSLEGIGCFSNAKTLVCPNAGLTALDLSGNPSLEYVDCRGNDLGTLDLSNNASLQTLYCDPDVETTGLDKAGLYFTDLVTSATQSQPGESSSSVRYEVAYDELGRPVEMSSTSSGGKMSSDAFLYDESFCLESSSAWNGEFSYSFEYDEGACLSSYTKRQSSYGGSSVTTDLSYNAQGLLTSESSLRDASTGGTSPESTSYTYNNGLIDHIAGSYASRTTGYSGSSDTQYSFDASGRLVGGVSKSDGSAAPVNVTLTVGYNDQGMCNKAVVSRMVEDYGNGSGASETSQVTDYDTQGFPVRTVQTDPYATVTVEYECNRDGYVTKATSSTDTSPLIPDGREISVSYVKMIGSLEDRPLFRYVPRFRFEGADLFSGFGDMATVWFQGYGDGDIATVMQRTPQDAARYAMGIQANTVQVPNEVILDAYDREHWLDGMAPSESADAPDATADPVEEPASEPEPEPESSAATVETDYCTAALPDSWAGKVDVAYLTGSEAGGAEITYKGHPDVVLAKFEVVDASSPENAGDAGYGRMWSATASNGKRVELWATQFPFMFWMDNASEKSGTGTQLYGSLTDAEREDLIYLCTGEHVSIQEVYAAKSQDLVTQRWVPACALYYQNVVAPGITVH